MKVKHLLYPVVLFVCFAMLVVGVFLPVFQQVWSNGQTLILGDEYGVFTNFANLKNVPSAYNGVFGILTSCFLIVGIIAVLILTLLTIVKVCNYDIEGFSSTMKVVGFVALIATIGYIVCALGFILVNHKLTYLNGSSYWGMQGMFSLWMMMGALILAVISAFMTLIDLSDLEEVKLVVAPKEEVKAEAAVVENKKEAKIVAKKTSVKVEKKAKSGAPAKVTVEETVVAAKIEKVPAKKNAKVAKEIVVEQKKVAKKPAKKEVEVVVEKEVKPAKVATKKTVAKTETKTTVKKAEAKPATKKTTKK